MGSSRDHVEFWGPFYWECSGKIETLSTRIASRGPDENALNVPKP